MNEQSLQELLDKGEWSAVECQQFLDYLEGGATQGLEPFLRERFESAMRHTLPQDKATAARLLTAIHGRMTPPAKPAGRVFFLPRSRWWVAASILILLAAGVDLWLGQRHASPVTPPPALATVNDLPPGGNRATLTLANGQSILLDSAANGVLAEQGSTQIQKLSNGQLIYSASATIPAQSKPGIPQTAARAAQPETYNTLSTPRGGQYQLILPDGTQVWLNAASSITYPTAFTGKTRLIRITGEAYFEVARDRSHPFIARITTTSTAKDDKTTMDVEVLGTHFNIHAYNDDQSIQTTLLEGSVRIVAAEQSRIISPGQQAVLSPGNNIIDLVPHPDLEEVMAWKNGLFHFDSAGIATVLRELARWYDVDVSYAGPIPQGTFSGEIGRSLTLAQVLKGLASARVHYRIEEGRRLTILP